MNKDYSCATQPAKHTFIVADSFDLGTVNLASLDTEDMSRKEDANLDCFRP